MIKALIPYLKAIDLMAVPITFIATWWLGKIKPALHFLPFSRKIFDYLGLMPVIHHYYEPIVFQRDLRYSLSLERPLPGIDLDVSGQLELLHKINCSSELTDIPLDDPGDGSFYYRNSLFESGDAECLFSLIRYFKPNNLIEIGAGYSTLIAQQAINKNKEDDFSYSCSHTCIEPFSAPWLEKTGANVIRNKAELVDIEVFQSLGSNDILFIDSSHVIRPQGDILFEYLELIPTLKSGVLVHIHDIYTPRDYPDKWVLTYSKLWNEQYVLEAYLSNNVEWKVLASLNYLWHNYREDLVSSCPMLAYHSEIEPTSFWMVRG